MGSSLGDVFVGGMTGTGLLGAGVSNVTGVGSSINDGLGNTFNELSGGAAKDRALAAQASATAQSNQVLSDTYKQQQNILNPYSQAGYSSLNSLQNNDFMNNWQQDPGYQFRLQEGQKAINNAAAARGMGNSGATMKALADYGQNAASAEYDKVYNRNYNRLSGLLNSGQNASNNMATVSGAYGSNISNNIMGQGNASAAAQIGQYNTLAGLAGQGATAAAMFCDENLKTNVEVLSNEDINEMKSHLTPYKFKYKEEKFGDGDWIGVMAQDLQKSKIGRLIVTEDADGNLMIDLKKAVCLLLAMEASHAG